MLDILAPLPPTLQHGWLPCWFDGLLTHSSLNRCHRYHGPAASIDAERDTHDAELGDLARLEGESGQRAQVFSGEK
ncbi:MAG: hypothetical protein Q8K54_06525 [Gallionella sp.]|nr:hypothetical protein [Gallionella sp.]